MVFVSVSKTNKPRAGDAMAVRCADVTRGIIKPFVVLFTSSMALVAAVEPSLLIATFCALIINAAKRRVKSKVNFFILVFFGCKRLCSFFFDLQLKNGKVYNGIKV